MDIMAKAIVQQSEKISHILNIQSSNSSDVPRYDRLTDPKGAGLNSAAWYYGPQKRLLGIYTFKYHDENKKWLQSVTANVNAQEIDDI